MLERRGTEKTCPTTICNTVVYYPRSLTHVALEGWPRKRHATLLNEPSPISEGILAIWNDRPPRSRRPTTDVLRKPQYSLLRHRRDTNHHDGGAVRSGDNPDPSRCVENGAVSEET